MRRAAKIDVNHAEIVAALRGVGADVQSLAQMGRGVPDVLAHYRGVYYLIEIKDGKDKLTAAEESWHLRWKGPVSVVRSPEEALELIGAVEPIGLNGAQRQNPPAQGE